MVSLPREGSRLGAYDPAGRPDVSNLPNEERLTTLALFWVKIFNKDQGIQTLAFKIVLKMYFLKLQLYM